MKNRLFYLKIFIFFLIVKFSVYLNRRVFVMVMGKIRPRQVKSVFHHTRNKRSSCSCSVASGAFIIYNDSVIHQGPVVQS